MQTKVVNIQKTQQEFLADVEVLRAKRVVVKDKEIAENTGFSTSIVSTYLAGRVNPSKNFIEKFYSHYGKDLQTKLDNDKAGTPEYTTELREKYITSLEEQVALQKEVIELLRRENDNLKNQIAKR